MNYWGMTGWSAPLYSAAVLLWLIPPAFLELSSTLPLPQEPVWASSPVSWSLLLRKELLLEHARWVLSVWHRGFGSLSTQSCHGDKTDTGSSKPHLHTPSEGQTLTSWGDSSMVCRVSNNTLRYDNALTQVQQSKCLCMLRHLMGRTLCSGATLQRLTCRYKSAGGGRARPNRGCHLTFSLSSASVMQVVLSSLR